MPGDILQIYAAGDLPIDIVLVKLCISVSVVSSYVSLHFAARTCIQDLVLRHGICPAALCGPATSGARVGNAKGAAEKQRKFTFRQLVAEALVYLTSTMAVALAVEKLDVVLNFTGAIACVPFMFIFPGLLLLKLDCNNTTDGFGSLRWRYNGYIFIVFGAAVCLVSVTTSVIDAAHLATIN